MCRCNCCPCRCCRLCCCKPCCCPRPPQIGPAEITVFFPGVEGVILQYYSSSTGFVQIEGIFNEYGSFIIPEEILAESTGFLLIRVIKAGMDYTFFFASWKQLVGVHELFVPVVPLTVTGITTDSSIGIAQHDWVYFPSPAAVGQPNRFNVFDNGNPYLVYIFKEGFYPVIIDNIDVAVNPNVHFDGFYTVSIPDGVSNVWISSNGWAVRGANASELITLMADFNNIAEANITFVFNGVTYYAAFLLDGNDPFYDILAQIFN
ncbi:MAG: hypothetical protein FWG44_00375 [Oscillospiraceae bacterium]|nr:hypothetical protein [Oscillospiraceae bacterium]